MRTGVPSWLAVLLGLALLCTSRHADACETESVDPGLTLDVADFEPIPLPAGGVLAVRGVAYGVEVDEALRQLQTWQVLRDGVAMPGEFATHPLYDAEATAVSPEAHVFVLVWRPAEPFAPGSVYRLDWGIADRGFGPRSVELDVRAEPPPPLVLPEIELDPRVDVVDGGEIVCCETPLSSCGNSSLCEPTVGTLLPALALELAGGLGAHPQQRLWIAQVLPDGALRPAEHARSLFAVHIDGWIGALRFDEPDDEYCAVVGVTSLVDGQELRSPPLCVPQAELGIPHTQQLEPSAALTPLDVDGDGEGRCIGPLVYQQDGEAYPREPDDARGCRQGPRGGPWWLVFAWLLVTRRTRARA